MAQPRLSCTQPEMASQQLLLEMIDIHTSNNFLLLITPCIPVVI